ncbi:hypothetical protein AUJ17_00580 [Candidatus Micrarchaeota archaeon CG1_02_47_40]|nr:MAG: hypothetical protein AUJ17_00580 [Candidatus Micrarchaeota archaeon CG1_02_47_40]
MGEAAEKLIGAGIRLTEGAMILLEKSPHANEAAEKLLEEKKVFVDAEDVEKIIAGIEKIPLPVEVRRSSDFHPIAKESAPNLRVLDHGDVSGKSRCTGTIENFVAYFNDRFERMRRLLRTRITDKPIIESCRIKDMQGQIVRVIGIVYEKRITKNGNLLIELEDLKGSTKVIVNAQSKAFPKSRSILLDDVIAVDGKVSDIFLIADELNYLDLPMVREQKKTESDLAIAYVSDLHVGSKNFLQKEFSRFLSWLGGEGGNAELAGKVKYIIIAGDNVDGIGIYPLQEKELVVKDIYKQYEMLDELLCQIPDYIEVVVCPGNHDAVRRADPQPMIGGNLLKSDVRRIGSPGYVEIEGLSHLVYHGNSLDGIIASLPNMDYAHPEKPMVELLKRRHLSPPYGSNLIVPEEKDYLIIEEEPDVVHMGHVHKNSTATYRGTLLVNSGTFQSRTDYQIRNGHVPSPGVVPVYETKLGKIHNVSFVGE